jgi:hypothetical protein
MRFAKFKAKVRETLIILMISIFRIYSADASSLSRLRNRLGSSTELKSFASFQQRS